jgi:hypothetical protein
VHVEEFDQPSTTLENYGRALSRIVALWPSQRVLEVIEESIFRKPGLPGADPFSLEAYRELVLLYHVAREISQAEHQEAAHGRAVHDTSMQPLNMREPPEAPEAALADLADLDLLLVPPPSTRLGVDIDIDELAPEEAAPRELPALDFDLGEPENDVAAEAQRKRS